MDSLYRFAIWFKLKETILKTLLGTYCYPPTYKDSHKIIQTKFS